jgi:hypothetical protein
VSNWKAQRSQSKSWTKVIRSTHCGRACRRLYKYNGSNASVIERSILCDLPPKLLVNLIERDTHLPISRPWWCQASNRSALLPGCDENSKGTFVFIYNTRSRPPSFCIVRLISLRFYLFKSLPPLSPPSPDTGFPLYPPIVPPLQSPVPRLAFASKGHNRLRRLLSPSTFETVFVGVVQHRLLWGQPGPFVRGRSDH